MLGIEIVLEIVLEIEIEIVIERAIETAMVYTEKEGKEAALRIRKDKVSIHKDEYRVRYSSSEGLEVSLLPFLGEEVKDAMNWC